MLMPRQMSTGVCLDPLTELNRAVLQTTDELQHQRLLTKLDEVVCKDCGEAAEAI